MNVTLPEKNKLKKKQIIIYTSIIIVLYVLLQLSMFSFMQESVLVNY